MDYIEKFLKCSHYRTVKIPIFGGCLYQTIDNLVCIEINNLFTWFYNRRTEKKPLFLVQETVILL